MKLRLPKSRRYRFLLYFLSLSLILLAIDLVWIRIDRHITIARDTTYITSPLTPDGRVDYLAALNTRAGDNTPPDQNAAITLLHIFGPTLFGNHIFGPTPLGSQSDHAIYDHFQLPFPSPTEKFYTRFSDFVSSHAPKLSPPELTARFERFDSLHLHPWTPSDDPFVAQFLDENARFLDLSTQTLNRTGYYLPLMSNSQDNTLVSVLLPSLAHTRELGYLLSTRAALRSAAGNFDGARTDVRTTLHLATLLNRQPFLVESLVATAMHENACATLQAIATESSFSADQFKTLRADLDALPPLSYVESIDAERFIALDYLQYAARVGPLKAFPMILSSEQSHQETSPMIALSLMLVPANFNQAMRETNRYYDDVIDAAHQPIYADRVARAKAVEQALQKRTPLGTFADPAQRIEFQLLPSISGAQRVTNRAAMTRDLTRLALSLAAYHADRNAYPPSLADLTPAYLPTVPEDLFINAPLHYTKTDAGYLLYSVGMNMQDDQAHNRDHPDPKFPQADDLTIRVPPSPPPPPPTTLPS